MNIEMVINNILMHLGTLSYDQVTLIAKINCSVNIFRSFWLSWNSIKTNVLKICMLMNSLGDHYKIPKECSLVLCHLANFVSFIRKVMKLQLMYWQLLSLFLKNNYRNNNNNFNNHNLRKVPLIALIQKK